MKTSTQSINPFYEARQRRVAPARANRPNPAGLCPTAQSTGHRQPGAAPDQPVP